MVNILINFYYGCMLKDKYVYRCNNLCLFKKNYDVCIYIKYILCYSNDLSFVNMQLCYLSSEKLSSSGGPSSIYIRCLPS